MKQLASILGVGLLVFMGLAMTQEWPVFAAWMHLREKARDPLTEEDRSAAIAIVRELLAMTNHLYASGGDRRFVERLPATEAVVDELLADLDYLRRNHRVQEPTLVRLEIRGVERFGPRELIITTREYWTMRFTSAVDGKPTDPPHSEVVSARYRVAADGSSWRVRAWDLVPPDEAPRPGEGG